MTRSCCEVFYVNIFYKVKCYLKNKLKTSSQNQINMFQSSAQSSKSFLTYSICSQQNLVLLWVLCYLFPPNSSDNHSASILCFLSNPTVNLSTSLTSSRFSILYLPVSFNIACHLKKNILLGDQHLIPG